MGRFAALLWLFLLPGAARGDQTQDKARALSKRYEGFNAIFISITNVAAGRMSLYGYPRPTTPKLDQWSSDAIVFDDAFTQAAWTLPMGVSVFTSLYPYTHGILIRTLDNALSVKTRTLPELLRDAGYATGAFTGGLDYYPGFSHMRGFQEAPKNPNFSGFETTIPQARRWLAKHGHEKFFLFLHGYDAHCPYRPSEPFLGMFGSTDPAKIHFDPAACVHGVKTTEGYQAMYLGGCPQFPSAQKCSDKAHRLLHLTQEDIDYLSDRYDETVRQANDLVGNFLASLDQGILRKTIIVVYSEHGEIFAKDGSFGRTGSHEGLNRDDVLHVPLIMKFPGGPSGRVRGLAQLIDVMPTLLDALALRPPRTMQGVDLAPLVEDGIAVNRYVYSGATSGKSSFFNYQRHAESIRDMGWKLIHEISVDTAAVSAEDGTPNDRFELYDIKLDPGETHDVSQSRPSEFKELRGKLDVWAQAQWAKRILASPKTQRVPKELIQDAREHGYWP